MSAFSRGLFLGRQCLQSMSNAIARNSFQQPRYFSSACNLRAQTKPLNAASKPKSGAPSSQTLKALRKNKPSSTPTKIPTATTTKAANTPSVLYKTYDQLLAEKTHTTLLYQAPSHLVLKIACYSTSLFCLSYAGITYYSNFLNAPPGLAPWIPYAFTLVSFMMAIGGGYVLLTPSGIIRSITAIPKSLHVQTGKKPFGPLQIEVEIKKMFPVPFFPARKIYVNPSELRLPSRISAPNDPRYKAADIARLRKREEIEAKKRWEYDREHIMTSPFRHMSQGGFQFFAAMRRTWVREGFMKVGVDGKNFKLDVSNGWALDEGRALDRLTSRTPKT